MNDTRESKIARRIERFKQQALSAKACNKIQNIKTAEDMHHAIFSPEGREFLKANPKLWSSLDLFALQNLMGLEGIEFYRDLTQYPLSIERSNTPCVFAFGGSFDGSSVSLHYSDPSQLYKAIVWDVEQLRIHIEAYCMLQLTIIGEMPVIDIIHQGEEAEIFYE